MDSNRRLGESGTEPPLQRGVALSEAGRPQSQATLRTVETNMATCNRRDFIKALSLAGISSLGDTSSLGPLQWGTENALSIEKLDIAIQGLPPAFDGYRIGFLTDIHLGIWMNEASIRRAIETVGKQQVDLLLLGGDYILVNETNVLERFGFISNPRFAGLDKKTATALIYDSFAEILSTYKGFSDGILAVVGNHDRWNMFPLFLDSMRKASSVRILINQEAIIRRGEQTLRVFGTDDYLTGIPTLPPSVPLPDDLSKRIVITHNPDYVSATIDQARSMYSLALCGHTHGGQIVLPLLGPVAAQVLDRRFISGYNHIAGTHIYTSRGMGYVGLPLRFYCSPEATIITLMRS